MRPVPIPDEAVSLLGGGQRVVIGEPGDPTRDDVRPCEYLVGASTLYPGRPTFTAVVVLDDEDREAIAAGAALTLTLDGAEVPWNVGWIRGLDMAHAAERPDGSESLAGLGEAMLRDSAAWFPKVHARGHEAVTAHLTLGVAGEAGEVADVIKKADVCGLVSTCDMHAPGKHDRDALASELADVLTYILALAAHEGIDLHTAYLAKRSENVDRWGEPDAMGSQP